jgi:hypothetical protein
MSTSPPTPMQLFMIGGILFFVIEMKLGFEGKDNVVQLFLELLCKSLVTCLTFVELVYSCR